MNCYAHQVTILVIQCIKLVTNYFAIKFCHYEVRVRRSDIVK